MSVVSPISLRWFLLAASDAPLLDDDVVVEALAIDLNLAERNKPAVHDENS
jgi:hypothetical protein